jgi:ABC-type uncharacterized transport system permease subunit
MNKVRYAIRFLCDGTAVTSFVGAFILLMVVVFHWLNTGVAFKGWQVMAKLAATAILFGFGALFTGFALDRFLGHQQGSGKG